MLHIARPPRDARVQQDRYEAAIEDNQQALQLCIKTGATKAKVARHASHVTRHTSHVTRHTSHVTRHTSTQLLDVHYQIGLGYFPLVLC